MASGQTILIVDDARLARKIMRSFVSKTRPELEVFEAADGAEALLMLNELPNPTYITIDYNMPGMNGMELAAQVKPRCAASRIALVTANVQTALRRRVAELGIDFIDKPVTEAKIAAFLGCVGSGDAEQP